MSRGGFYCRAPPSKAGPRGRGKIWRSAAGGLSFSGRSHCLRPGRASLINTSPALAQHRLRRVAEAQRRRETGGRDPVPAARLIAMARDPEPRSRSAISAARSDPVALNRLRAKQAAAEQAPAVVGVDHEVHWDAGCTVIGLATRGIMMIESCKVMTPAENQIPVAWNG
jgi:hypothetical protein